MSSGHDARLKKAAQQRKIAVLKVRFVVTSIHLGHVLSISKAGGAV